MYEYNGRVENIVDGDTIDVTIDVGFYMTAKLRLRLLGVNAPEMHGESAKAGQIAKDFTTVCLLNKDVVIHTEKSDSFGRWLATVFVYGKNFNEELLSSDNAVIYKRK